MATHISVHHVDTITASTVQGGECSPHLTINWRKNNSDGSENYEASGAITFYLKDADLNDNLIEMINRIVREHGAKQTAEAK
jgi:hypothetical protein